MPAFDLFEIREADTVSIVRFAQEIDNFSHRASELHEQLLRFVGDHSCLKLVIDLKDTTYLPSSVLGVLVQLHNHGCEVHLANASDDVVEVLHVTQLVRMIHVNETAVEPWSEDISERLEVVVVGVQGYCVTCPECLHEVDTDKHNIGKRTVCGHCDHEFAVAAELLREATHLSADCPSCHNRLRFRREQLQQTIPCPLCDTQMEIRMIV